MAYFDVTATAKREARFRLFHDRASMLLAALLVACTCTGFVVVADQHLAPQHAFWVRVCLLGLVSIPSLLAILVFLWGYFGIRRSDYGA